MTEEPRTCSRCYKPFPVSHYYTFKNRSNGKTYRRSICRACYTEQFDRRICKQCGQKKYRNRMTSDEVCMDCTTGSKELVEAARYDYVFALDLLGWNPYKAYAWVRRGYAKSGLMISHEELAKGEVSARKGLRDNRAEQDPQAT